MRPINSMILCCAMAATLSITGGEIRAGHPGEDEQTKNTMIEGDCQTVYEAEICTWAKMSGDKLLKFGASVPVSLAENAPLDAEMVFPPITLARITVPAEVTEKTGINHLGVNWEVMGHPPGTFMTPHFDFHLYTLSGEGIEAIDCSDLSKPEQAPDGYILPDITIPDMGTLVGLCVPEMGMHALDEKEMTASEMFGAAMIVGFYAKETIFIEPMIARKTLLDREDFSLAIPGGLADLGNGTAWPSSFKAVYDEESSVWHLVFSMP